MASHQDQDQDQNQEQHQHLNTEPLSSTPLNEYLPPPSSFQDFQQKTPVLIHRPGYARVPSVSFADERVSEQGDFNDEGNLQAPGSTTIGKGLGIALSRPPARVETIITHGKAPEIPEQLIPGMKPLMSPPSTGGLSGSTRYDSPYSDFDTSHAAGKFPAKQSLASLQSTSQPSVYANSEAGLLSVRSKYDTFAPEHQCRSVREVKRTRLTWIALTILALSLYSTVMSALFLVVAVVGPRYRMIRTNGLLTISGATVLTTFFAKTIELSFVTVIVALLGQALARRAHDKRRAGGITLAEIGMRSWILQPGTLVTHWESVRYAGVTVLGIMSLLAAILALLYVTAANAVVQPQLKFAGPRPQLMKGLVKTSFANPYYMKRECKTPVPWPSMDLEDGGPTCLQLEHAAMAFHNYHAYLSEWSALAKSGNGTGDLHSRPKGFAIMNDNTTITAAWVEQEFNNMTQLHEDWGFVVVNISMAMPHAGVISAAMDPVNNIIQPEDLNGQGIYRIHASVPSPVVHVLCAMLSEEHLKPFDLRSYSETSDANAHGYNLSDPYLGGTKLDDLFKWGPSYGEYKWPPVFPKLPVSYNTIINDTNHIARGYGRDAIYLLGNSTQVNATGSLIYPLCQLTVNQTPFCSTRYNASSTGATMEAVCEDTPDEMAYINSLTNATSGNVSLTREWPNIAGEWIKSLALNHGAVDGNGSNSRVLNQLVSLQPELNPILPSIAEALAVMAGSALLTSTKDAPFVQFFNYTATENILSPGNYQHFNASIEAQQYASGGTAAYQRAFILVLFLVFILNLLALAYFVTHRDWYADVSEPSNLFTLAINSPPSKELAGSCGGGPHGKQFRSAWKLQENGGHVYMESLENDREEESAALRRRMRRSRRLSEGFDIVMTPVRKARESFGERVGH